MLLRKKAINSAILIASILLSILVLFLISVVIISPWYKTLEFESNSAAWNCKLLIKRNAFYGYKECNCEDAKLGRFPPGWCEDGYYDWRNCDNCDNIGCACEMELRLWNSTFGFVLIAWGLSFIVTIMLLLQLSDTIKGFQTSYTQTTINSLNFLIFIFLFTSFFLFLELPSALRQDYGTRCDNFGICSSFIGSLSEYINWQTFYYPATQSWGPSFGWWILLVSILMSIINTFVTLSYSYTLHKLIGSFY